MRKIFAVWLSIMLTFSSTFIFHNLCEDTEGKVVVQGSIAYVPHAPIIINGNGDFPSIASSGDGSPGTPWIIEGWEIDGTGFDYCIYISNTTEHYEVKNCYLHSASFPISSGLKLVNSQNAIISRIVAQNNTNGIIVTDSGIIPSNYCNNLNITSNNISYSSSDGIRIASGTYGGMRSFNCSIHNNTVFNSSSDGIFADSNVSIIKNNVHNNSNGLSLLNRFNIVDNNSIHNNQNGVLTRINSTIQNNSIYMNEIGIDIDDGMDRWGNNTICYNDIYSNDYGIEASHSVNNSIKINNITSNNNRGVTLSQSNNNIVESNEIHNNSWGIFIFSGGEKVLSNNISNNSYSGILFFESDYSIVKENKLDNNGYCMAFNIQDSTNLTFQNNTLTNCGFFMIGDQIDKWNTHTIDNSNTVNNNPVYYYKNQVGGVVPLDSGGVILANCTNMLIENLDIRYSGGGIQLGFSSENIIRENYAYENYIGISLRYSSNNSLENNTCEYGSRYGMRIVYSFFNEITNNTLTSLEYGVYLDTSQLNSIYHNNFFNNINQAFDNDVNSWHNGYPSGGNYWSDYSGSDDFHGPSQNIPGSDGLGDSNYTNIQGGSNIDEYPLMTLFEFTEYSILLQEGWNLISIPIRQFDWSINTVLESIDGMWDCIQTYDTYTSTWLSNSTHRPDVLDNLDVINHLKGYWINITTPTPTILTVKGERFRSNKSVPLLAGWNLVGCPTLNVDTIENQLIGTGYDMPVEAYDDVSPYRLKQILDSDFMFPGEGYWVHVPADATWLVEQSPPLNPNICVQKIEFSNGQPENGEMITIEVEIVNYGADASAVDVKFYDGTESSENLIGMDRIAVPSISQVSSCVDWVAMPGGPHSILVTAYLNDTWASHFGVVDFNPMDNNLSANLFVVPNYLLVDDDNHFNDQSPGDTVSFMRGAFNSTNFDYSLTTVGAGANGPGYDYGDYPMEEYDVVVWMCGYETINTLTLTDITELGKFLDGGGDLWLISQGFWDEATGNPDLTNFALNYLHVPNMPPILNSGLPPKLYGNASHPVTYSFANDPHNTTDRLAGAVYEWSYWWDVNSVPLGTMALNSSNQCYAVTYNSDDDGSNPVKESRVFIQTWEFSRIEDAATQAQFTYKVLLWLGNIPYVLGRDFSVSQQEIRPKTVNVSDTVNISAVIRNNAFMNFTLADDVFVRLFHNSSPIPSSNFQIPFLEKMGGEYEVSFTWTADTVGTHEFIWVVDPDNLISETNEYNNQISIYLNNITVEVLP